MDDRYLNALIRFAAGLCALSFRIIGVSVTCDTTKLGHAKGADMGRRWPRAHIFSQRLSRTNVIDQANMIELIELHIGMIDQLRHDGGKSGVQKGGALFVYLDHRPINIHLLISQTRTAVMKKTQHRQNRRHVEHGQRVPHPLVSRQTQSIPHR